MTGEGVNACHVNLHNEAAGCRKCGDGSGKLTAAQLVEHASAAGAVEVDLTGGAGRPPEWWWTTADGRKRRQYRTPDGTKKWAITDPPNNPPPADLMYAPAGVPSGAAPVYACEGASDTDAVSGLGLSAIGRTNAKPSVASLRRLDRGAVLRVWPDNDQPGYKQAATWADAATAAGLTVEAIDPLALRPDAPPGYDARDWIGELPDGTTADAAAVLLGAAVVEVKVIRARMRSAPISAPASTKPISPPDAPDAPDALVGIVPRERVRMCDSERQIADLIADHAAGRLVSVFEESAWLAWRDGRGWEPIETPALLATAAAVGRANLGGINAKGLEVWHPATGGRAATAGGVLRILAGLPGILTHAAEWDADAALAGLPNGEILNLATGNRRPAKREDQIRRRLGAMPATDAEYSRSRFAAVLNHCIPDPDARAFLKRRLGAALQNAEGLDHFVCLHGPGGSGKGSLFTAIRAVFGKYESGIPTAEILTGGRRSHSAWKARLQGCRLMTVDDIPIERDLDPGVIKELIGGRLNGVQHMGREFFDLTIHAPILTAGNAPPSVPGMDSGTERRLVPIKCGPPVTNPDPRFRESMATDPAERGACLRWLINGGVEFRAAGCPVPDAAREDAAEVGRAAPIGEFTLQWVARHGAERRLINDIYQAWQAFMVGSGQHAGAKKTLSTKLVAAGWDRKRIQGMSWLTPPVGGASSASSTCTNRTRMEIQNEDFSIGSKVDHAPLALLAPPEDMPAGALDCYASGADQGPPPTNGRAGFADMPPPARLRDADRRVRRTADKRIRRATAGPVHRRHGRAARYASRGRYGRQGCDDTATDSRGHSLMRQWDYSPDRSPPPNTGTGEYRPGPPDDVAPWLVWPADAVRVDSPVGAGTNRKAALRDARRRVGPGPALTAVRTTERERAILRRLRGRQ